MPDQESRGIKNKDKLKQEKCQYFLPKLDGSCSFLKPKIYHLGALHSVRERLILERWILKLKS